MKAAVMVVLVLALVACAPTQANPSRQGTTLSRPVPSPKPTLAAAIRQAVHLGPADKATTVTLSFGLKVRNADRLAALLASGRTVTPEVYAAQFGPDPAAAQAAVEWLQHTGFLASWRAGSNLIAADGPAPLVAALLRVDIETFRLADGTTFYAALDQPQIPPQLAGAASSVIGLDSYRRARTLAVRHGGLTPTDVLAFYNLQPLRQAGLDGTGQTIVLPEIDDLPNLNDLNKFATEFSLPPFDSILTVKRDPNWGTPEKPQGETVLDLEIIHEVAPNAKIVIYLSAADFGHGDRGFDAMVTDHLGSIISESLGACEPDTSSGHRSEYSAIQDRAAAFGMSHFVASGDSGAYTCGQDQPPAGSFPSTLPSVTAVGGTTVFESAQGIYYKESAWGGPLDESGSGGGPSQFYAVPDYQKSVSQTAGHGLRQVPDVAANADPDTGFHIVFGGQDGQAGGTSAATPLWAATVALINQDLKKKGLREVGFANPALYWMGANSATLPAKPFHDVTIGNNLANDAGTGWDFATGWGSMDGAALDAAWILYIKGGGG
ncbi:MAG TPA: S53 family peptidase [Candidatus Dormibacteraeota bacterium]|nr:S53 family peptidase [Candidatus Dormibacteraeota bacterium]